MLKMKNVAYISIAQMLSIILGLCSTLLWTRFVESQDYGTFILIISTLPIATAFSAKGLDYSAQISASKKFHKNFDAIIKLRFCMSFLGSLVLILFSIYYWYQSQSIIAYALAFMVIVFPVYNLKSVLESWLNGAGHFGWLSLFLVLPQIFFLGIFCFVLLLGGYIESLPFFLILIGLSTNLYFFDLVKKSNDNFHSDDEPIKYGRRISAAFIIPITIASLDKLIIFSTVSIEAVAIISIALIPSQQLGSAFSIFYRLLTPEISSAASIRSAWLAIKYRFWMLSALSVLIGLFCFFYIDNIVIFVFGIKYSQSAHFAQGLTASFALCLAPTLLGNILRAQNRVAFNYFFEFFNSATKFLVFLFGGYLYGINGIVLGLISANIIMAFVFISYFLWDYFNE